MGYFGLNTARSRYYRNTRHYGSQSCACKPARRASGSDVQKSRPQLTGVSYALLFSERKDQEGFRSGWILGSIRSEPSRGQICHAGQMEPIDHQAPTAGRTCEVIPAHLFLSCSTLTNFSHFYYASHHMHHLLKVRLWPYSPTATAS